MLPESKYAWSVIAGSLALLTFFHFLVYDVPFGWPLTLWVVLIAVALVALRHGIKTPQNIWAYLFLGPAGIALIAELFLGNSVMRFFAALLCIISLGFFAYWLFAPKASLKSLQNFWPRTWILETFFPVEGRGPWSKLGVGSGSKQALIGILAAVPFVLIFIGLFLSADPLIGKVLSTAFHFDDPSKLIGQLIVDAVIGLYLLRWIWMAFTRAAHDRHPQWFEIKTSESHALYISFLSVLNILFLGFIGFQFVYFFGGQGIVESYGLTYASYAREGFFQLFTVSIIVFSLVYAVTAKNRMQSLVVRLLSLALILQSWIVIASAIKRFTLYVDGYGLSVLRYWALTGLIVAAIALLILAIWLVAKASFGALEKVLAVGTLFLFSALLLVNFESIIVNWNAGRLPTEAVVADYLYPAQLSTDAVPAYVAWLKQADPSTKINCQEITYRLNVSVHSNALNRQEADRLLKEYQDATGNRMSMFVDSYEADEMMSVYWRGAYIDCNISDWKAVLRLADRENLRKEMADPRKRTWSGMQALEAYDSL